MDEIKLIKQYKLYITKLKIKYIFINVTLQKQNIKRDRDSF